MKEVKIESTLYVYDTLNELPNDIAILMNKAINREFDLNITQFFGNYQC